MSCVASTWLTVSSQASPPTPDRIVFPFENASDLRGFLDVLQTFRLACLSQPLTRDLPARLVPDGYRVVTRDIHWWGEDKGAYPDTAILSKTGREDTDLAGGYPIIDLMLPTVKLPNGACSVRWKRSWEQAEVGRPMVLDLPASLPARVSFYLQAVLLSQPDDMFSLADRYSTLTTWRAPCLKTKECSFHVNAQFDAKGIDMTISLGKIERPTHGAHSN